MSFSSDSEAESSCPSFDNHFRLFKRNGMIKLEERDKEHDLIKAGQSRLEAFRIYSEAMHKKCGGNANIKYAWFGSSKDEICNIISHGFSTTMEPKSGDCFGIGVHLYPANVDG
ncbi:hypothetical protein RND71_023138 [Anisodus tanguticus]|uniref:PARP catalytic domain-containing protein n=1 Tax=Anisodus tanguticus TaxID=243964 RepID=A0AAE1RV15_9SOLA|nr:hypothetical protein RND71_023138 [Anisodus tanguticus]